MTSLTEPSEFGTPSCVVFLQALACTALRARRKEVRSCRRKFWWVMTSKFINWPLTTPHTNSNLDKHFCILHAITFCWKSSHKDLPTCPLPNMWLLGCITTLDFAACTVPNNRRIENNYIYGLGFQGDKNEGIMRCACPSACFKSEISSLISITP